MLFLPSSFPVPSCPDLWFPLWWEQHCLATGAQLDVIMRPYRGCRDNALVTRVSTRHLDTARALEPFGRGSGGNAASLVQHDGKGPPAPHAGGSLPSRPGRGLTTVDGDGGDEHPNARQRMHLQTIITSQCEGLIEGLLAKPRVCPGLGSDAPTLSSSEVTTDCQEGLQ